MKTPQEGEEKEEALLEEKYKKLEEHWNTCKQSNPPHKVLRRCSTGSSSSSSSSVDQLFNKYSPRELMSSLQVKHRRSVPPPPPSEGRGSYMMMMFNSKVRENDDMLVELLRDRLSAIQSGKLKGRRLFQDSDDDDDELDLDHGEEICSDCFDLIITQQSEQLKSVVSSYASDHEIINDGCTPGGISKEDDDDELCSPSSSTSSSSLIISNEKLVEREKVVVAMERENNVISVAGEKINIGKGKRVKTNMPAAMAWLGIVLMLFVIWMSCNGWYVGTEDDVEVFLVPT